jgi:hypothetical protein
VGSDASNDNLHHAGQPHTHRQLHRAAVTSDNTTLPQQLLLQNHLSRIGDVHKTQHAATRSNTQQYNQPTRSKNNHTCINAQQQHNSINLLSH